MQRLLLILTLTFSCCIIASAQNDTKNYYKTPSKKRECEKSEATVGGAFGEAVTVKGCDNDKIVIAASKAYQPAPPSKEIIEFHRKTRVLPTRYSGYKIEVLKVYDELHPQHPIFARFGKLNYDEIEGDDLPFAYLLGDFEDAQAAHSFMKNIILPYYPSAKVVRYKKGNRKGYETP